MNKKNIGKIPYSKPSITELEVRYAMDAVANGWGEQCYEYIALFESKFAAYLGVKHAIATSSCTGALHIGMAALGIGVGDEVILADTNWVASAAPITYLGAKPIFVDILQDSWCIDPDLAEAAISPRTKAILAVHLYGNLCDMERLLAISNRYGIPIIEDSAEAIGSIWHGKRAGSMGAFGTFSFHGTKTMTTGEGGMFVTDDDDLYERALTLSNHGRVKSQMKQFWPEVIGFKYKMSNLQAAIGCAQLERIDELVTEKRKIFGEYRLGLSRVEGISLNIEPVGTRNGYWMPTAYFSEKANITRDQLIEAFNNQNVDARVVFSPLSSTPPFSGLPSPNALSFSDRALNLPSFHGMSLVDQGRVIATILSAVGGV
jgi:perosamine synthetase